MLWSTFSTLRRHSSCWCKPPQLPRERAIFRSFYNNFVAEECDSTLTGVVQHRFFWRPDGVPLNHNPDARPMRQSWFGSVIENGAFYITKVDVFRQEQSRLAGRIGIYTMASEHLTEIDEPEDWVTVERQLRQRQRPDPPCQTEGAYLRR